MAIPASEFIWHNGKLILWDDAKLHILAHVVNYGSSVFEGIRAYQTQKGSAVFRLRDHMQRLIHSAKVYRMETDYSVEDLSQATIDLLTANKSGGCYIRPLILRGYGQLGVNPLSSPVEVYIANYAWGKYLAGENEDEGVEVCVSSWSRLAPNTMPTMAKAGANYMNSQLIKMEAVLNGYAEGIALDVNGFVSEGSGENIFLVQQGRLFTPPLGNSVLPGITRSSVIQLARELGIEVVEQLIPREMLYLADEVFFTGTAAEITPIGSVDKIPVGSGLAGPVTKRLRTEFFRIVTGEVEDRFNWLTPVPVKQPVAV